MSWAGSPPRRHCAVVVVCWFAVLLLTPNALAANSSPAPAFLTAGPQEPPHNGAAYVSLEAAKVFVNQQQNRSTPFSEFTLGALARGTEQTRGEVMPVFVPGASPALVQFRFLGQSSNLDGTAQHQKRDVVIHSTSQSTLDIRKPVRLDAGGLTLLPLEGCVRTDIDVHCIDARRLVRKLAERRVAKQQGEAEAIKSNRLREQVGAELEKEVAKQLNPAQKTYQEKVRDMLRARAAFPRVVNTRTTDGRMELRLLHQNADQLPPPSAATVLQPDLDLAIVMHESLFANMAESMWAGSTVQDEQFLQFMKTATGRPPRELWVHDRTPRWSLTLADRLPLTGEFRNDRMRVVVRCKGASRGAEEFNGQFEVSAIYQMFITIDGPQLVRDGELTFAFTDGRPETPDRNDWKAFLSRKFEGLLQPEVNFDGLTPPAGGAGDKLRKFRLAALASNNEWIRIGYALTDASPQSPASSPNPAANDPAATNEADRIE